MHLIAIQHYCLYTYIIIPIYKKYIDIMKLNLNNSIISYHRSNGTIEKHTSLKSLFRSLSI